MEVTTEVGEQVPAPEEGVEVPTREVLTEVGEAALEDY